MTQVPKVSQGIQLVLSLACRSSTALAPLDTSDTAIDAMAPVLENVLVCLTHEYEKRLQQKDNQVKASQHDVKAAQTALKQAQMELYEAHKTLAQNANALPVCESHPGLIPFIVRWPSIL